MRSQIYVGTEIKLNVSIDPIGEYTMDKYEFVVQFYCSQSRVVEIKKAEAYREDDSNYIFCLDTEETGIGRLKCKVIAQVPDGQFVGGRTEISVIDTGIDIVNHI